MNHTGEEDKDEDGSGGNGDGNQEIAASPYDGATEEIHHNEKTGCRVLLAIDSRIVIKRMPKHTAMNHALAKNEIAIMDELRRTRAVCSPHAHDGLANVHSKTGSIDLECPRVADFCTVLDAMLQHDPTQRPSMSATALRFSAKN